MTKEAGRGMTREREQQNEARNRKREERCKGRKAETGQWKREKAATSTGIK